MSEVIPPTEPHIPDGPSTPKPQTSPEEAASRPTAEVTHRSSAAPGKRSRWPRPQQAVIIAVVVALIGAAATIAAALISRPAHGGSAATVSGTINSRRMGLSSPKGNRSLLPGPCKTFRRIIIFGFSFNMAVSKNTGQATRILLSSAGDGRRLYSWEKHVPLRSGLSILDPTA
jgi:hypothetical protein